MSKDFFDIDGDGDLDFVDAEIWGVDDDYNSEIDIDEEDDEEEAEDLEDDTFELEIIFDNNLDDKIEDDEEN